MGTNTRRDPGAEVRVENLALILALIHGVIGFGVALAILWGGTSPLLRGEGRSIGEVAAFSGATLAALGFCFVVLRHRGEILPWFREVRRTRRLLDLVGLTVMVGALTFLAVGGLFAVFQDAFRQVQLDPWAGSLLVALACAASTYLAAGSAGSLNTESLALLVAGFLVVGALASALNAADELWWQEHFSALGTASDLSGWAFNFTLILTGLVVMTLADFLTHDMRVWADSVGAARWRVNVVRLGVAIMGAMLGMVGVIPVHVSLFWHNFVTYVAIGAFVVLLVGVPILFPSLSRGFIVVTVVIAAALAATIVMHNVIPYLNTTAFEIISVSTVFVWLVLFIRTLVAAVRDVGHAERAQLDEDVAEYLRQRASASEG